MVGAKFGQAFPIGCGAVSPGQLVVVGDIADGKHPQVTGQTVR